MLLDFFLAHTILILKMTIIRYQVICIIKHNITVLIYTSIERSIVALHICNVMELRMLYGFRRYVTSFFKRFTH